ncbi:hypothetical protein ACWGJ9_09715 [Curtobacterium citreum]
MLLAALAVVTLTGCAHEGPTPEAAASATAAVQQAYDNLATPSPLASTAPSAACDARIAEAAALRVPGGPVGSDVANALRNAVRSCTTTDQFATAVRAHPNVLGSAGLTADDAILSLLDDTCHLWNKSDSDALTCRDAELRNLIDWRSSDYD